ncbi:aldo/keto reductase [Oenococcus sicerae]|uniref:Aldo/keto reductase n=1 Tax=Oenococcus sicerae TaxID=2203724 RepID=A0AAJ1VLY6_9LACO|nr:aldo/keto reductase [Oenococcus sicerae]MDN6899978.1 aldo/keto reductase [Oenococcus sicerae]QAS69594.1 aldo/keto reductase [Oenococcus sicerae]VDK13655.1 Oxidoreductase YdhF [Oenococcus sicerae]
MKQIELGQSGLTASQIALGVMRINDRNAKQAAETVSAALEAGIDYFDTADIYGAGVSSTVFGQALKDVGVDRDKIHIQTKAGIIIKDGQINGDGLKGFRYDFSRDHLISAVDIELQRLQTDHVDFLLLHRPDTLMDPDEVAEAFSQLEASGKVLHFGVSNFTPYDVDLLQQSVSQRLEVNQLQFGLAHADMIRENIHLNISGNADYENHIRTFDVLTYSRLHKMTIQAWSPFQYGMFAGVFIDNPKFKKLNDLLQQIADKYQATKSGVAVAWILKHPAKIQTILGSMSPNHIKEMADVDSIHLTNQEWYDLYQTSVNPLP